MDAVPAVLPPVRPRPAVGPPIRQTPEVPPPAQTVPEMVPPARVDAGVLPPVPQMPEVSFLFTGQEREPELDPLTAIVVVAKQQHIHESSATWRAVRKRLSDKSRAGQCARAAADELSASARSREEAGIETVAEAESGRIKALADWLLRCALAVLEHLGMKKAGRTATAGPGAVGASPAESRVASTSTASQPVAEAKLASRSVLESALNYAPRQFEAHALPRLNKLLALSNEGFTDMKPMLVNDDEVDQLAREGLIRLEAQHQHDADERERAELELHANAIERAIAAEERKLKKTPNKRWFGKAVVLDVGTVRRQEIVREVVRKTLPARVEAVRSVSRQLLGWTPVEAPHRLSGGAFPISRSGV